MGGKTQTTQQQSSSTPTGFPLLADIYNRVSSVASQPYSPYQGQMVAGLTDTQKSGIQGVTNAQGAAQPYFDQASQYATQGAAAIDPSQIQRYMSPYTQNVIDATRANFQQDNAIGQQQVIGNAAAKGALGGDRVGVAQAELARQQGLAQNPVIAGMYSGAYDKALGAAQQDRSAQAQGAYTYGALAPSVQNAKISGAQAQIGAGGLEQGTQQAGLTADYNKYLQQLAFPYQQAGFLASAGLPAVNAMGGTTTGQTTTPGPNPWGQVAGLGLTAASFLKDGGVVKGYAGGGPVGLFDIDTYVPKYSGIQSMSPYGQPPALPKIGNPQAAMAGPTVGQVGGAVTGLKSLFGGAFQPGGGMYDANMMGAIPSSVTGMVGGGLKRGGRVSGHPQIFRSGGRVTDKHAKFHATVHAIRQTLRGSGPVHGYATGGDVRFDDAFSPFAVPPDNTPPNRDLAMAMGDKYQPEGSIELNAGAPMPRPRPFEAPGAPVGSIPEDGGLPTQAMAYGAPQPSPYAAGPPTPPPMPPDTSNAPAPPAKPSRGLFGNPFGLSDEARQGLLAAGLGTLASRSPFALSALGEGGLQGMKSYTEQKASKQKIDSEARKLAQTAEQFAQNLGLHRDQLGLQRENAAETKRQHDLAAQKPFKIGVDSMGREIFAIPSKDPKDQTPIPIDPNTGKPRTDPAAIAAATAASKPLTPDEYLEQRVPADQRDYIKKYANYDIDPKNVSVRNNRREIMDNHAIHVNPDFNTGNYALAYRTKQAFATGMEARAVRSNNVGIQHLGVMEEALQALNTGNVQAINAAKNKFKEMFGYAEPTDVKAIQTILGGEIAKAIVGGQNSDNDRKEARAIVDGIKSPDQIAGAIKRVKQLMGGQVVGLRQQYEGNTGLKDFDKFLLPDTIKELTGTPTLTMGAPLPKAISKAEYDKLPPKARFIGPDGKEWTKP